MVSLSDVSNTLAIKGIAETVSGTIAAVVPMDFPTSALVKGIRMTSKMMNGKLLNTFTIKLRIPYTILFGLSPPGAVSVSITAGINPSITEKSVDQKTMTRVFQNACRIIG